MLNLPGKVSIFKAEKLVSMNIDMFAYGIEKDIFVSQQFSIYVVSMFIVCFCLFVYGVNKTVSCFLFCVFILCWPVSFLSDFHVPVVLLNFVSFCVWV